MNLKVFGLVLSTCTATLAAHGALVAWQGRLQQRWAAQQEASIVRVVRAELDPLRVEVARTQGRVDLHLAWHAGRQ